MKVVPIRPKPPAHDNETQLQCSDPCGNRAFTLAQSTDDEGELYWTALCTACHHPAMCVSNDAVVMVEPDDDSDCDDVD